MGVSPAGTLVPQTPNFDSLRFEIKKEQMDCKAIHPSGKSRKLSFLAGFRAEP